MSVILFCWEVMEAMGCFSRVRKKQAKITAKKAWLQAFLAEPSFLFLLYLFLILNSTQRLDKKSRWCYNR